MIVFHVRVTVYDTMNWTDRPEEAVLTQILRYRTRSLISVYTINYSFTSFSSKMDFCSNVMTSMIRRWDIYGIKTAMKSTLKLLLTFTSNLFDDILLHVWSTWTYTKFKRIDILQGRQLFQICFGSLLKRAILWKKRICSLWDQILSLIE